MDIFGIGKCPKCGTSVSRTDYFLMSIGRKKRVNCQNCNAVLYVSPIKYLILAYMTLAMALLIQWIPDTFHWAYAFVILIPWFVASLLLAKVNLEKEKPKNP